MVAGRTPRPGHRQREDRRPAGRRRAPRARPGARGGLPLAGRRAGTGPGRARAAMGGAGLTEAGLEVSVLLTGAPISDVTPPASRAWPGPQRAPLASLTGWLGNFTASWRTGAGQEQPDRPRPVYALQRLRRCLPWRGDRLQLPDRPGPLPRPSRLREGLRRGGGHRFPDRPAATTEARFDLVSDLNDAPAFAMHQPPQGYLHAGADVARQHAHALQLHTAGGRVRSPSSSATRKACAPTAVTRPRAAPHVSTFVRREAIGSRWRDGKGDIEVTPNLCMGCGACTARSARPAPSATAIPAPKRSASACARWSLPTTPPAAVMPCCCCTARNTATRAILALGRAARAGQARGVPPNVIPVPVFHPAATGIDLWLAALSWGAGGVAVLLTGDEAPAVPRRAGRTDGRGARHCRGAGLSRVAADAGGSGRCGRARCRPGRTRQPAGARDRAPPPAQFPCRAGQARDARLRHRPSRPPCPGARRGGAAARRRAAGRHYRGYGPLHALCMACGGRVPSNALRDNAERPVLAFVERNCVQWWPVRDHLPRRTPSRWCRAC